MKRPSQSRHRATLQARRIAALAFVTTLLPLGSAAGAQTRSAHDTATAYGARLNAKGEPANLNPNRINNRVNNRIDTRLSLRVERYRPDSTANPTAAFATRSTDNARIGVGAALSPLATPAPTSVSQAAEETQASSQPWSRQTDDPSRPR